MANTRFFLYKPILFFLILFLLDKIFLLPFFKTKFVQDGNSIYYKHRELLVKKLANRKDSKKLITIFGDSRAYAYSELAFKGDRKEKYTVYNFSSPQAVTAYSTFILEKILKTNIKPELLIFVISPEGFDDTKEIFHSPFVRLGSDDDFNSRYFSYYPITAKKDFYLDEFIQFRKLEFDYKLLIDRLVKRKFSEYSIDTNTKLPLLDVSNGAQLAYMSFDNDIQKLEKDSLRIKNIYLGSNFKINDTSFYFVEEFLKLSQKYEIPAFIIWPRVYKSYRNYYSSYNLESQFGERLKELTVKYNQKYYNFNESPECDTFYDASHQSVICFDKNLNFLVDEFEKTK
jgi:hypothetical protein